MTPELALRASIWLSVLAWAVSEVLRRRHAGHGSAARNAYAAGALLLILHTAAAFEFRHGWSHDAAFEATASRSAAVTGFAAGAGIYLNYLLVVAWTADALFWLVRPQAYLRRARAIEITMFAFLIFMFVNGAVIFVAGPMRAAGAAAVTIALAARFARPSAQPVRRTA